MSKIGHFSHIVMEVTNIERSELFYREALGLDPVGRNVWPEEEPNTTFRTRDGQYVVLVEVAQMPPEDSGVHTNFMLSDEDYSVVDARLREMGYLTREDQRAERRSVGEVSTYLYDPDGHQLQITAYGPSAFDVPPSRRGKIVAGSIDDFPVGSVTRNKDGAFYVVSLQEGMLAVSEVCTHRQCTVRYEPEHYRFWCPCHDNKFTRKGEHIGHTPGTPPLHVYGIEFVDGQIIVDTDTSVSRTAEEADQMVRVPGRREGVVQ